MRNAYLLVVFVCFFNSSWAQLLKGTVMDAKTDVPVSGATILNASKGQYKKASYAGTYAIAAAVGDRIVFSSAGYRADTLNVTDELLRSGMDVGLQILTESMDTVTFRRDSYAQDSLNRRADYAHFYRQKDPMVLSGQPPATGFGLSISPFNYFSKGNKARRRFKKELVRIEERAYVDYYFSPSYVHRVTGLKGDSLYSFMRQFRPSYSFVRKSTRQDLLLYINDSFKEFKKAKDD